MIDRCIIILYVCSFTFGICLHHHNHLTLRWADWGFKFFLFFPFTIVLLSFPIFLSVFFCSVQRFLCLFRSLFTFYIASTLLQFTVCRSVGVFAPFLFLCCSVLSFAPFLTSFYFLIWHSARPGRLCVYVRAHTLIYKTVGRKDFSTAADELSHSTKSRAINCEMCATFKMQ